MKLFRYLIALVALFISGNLFAGQDPVTVNFISGSIPAQTVVGTQYSITYKLVNTLPFAQSVTVTGNGAASAVGAAISPSIPACNVGTATSLGANGACGVSLVFNPSVAGNYSLYLTMKYGSSTVNFPSSAIQTTTSANTPPVINVTGALTNPTPSQWPTSITQNESINNITFTFTNTGNTAVNISNPSVTTGTGVPGFTQSGGTCSTSSSLGGGDSCTIEGSYTPTSTGYVTLTATLNYGVTSPTSIATINTPTTQITPPASSVVTGALTSPNVFPTNVTEYTRTPVVFTFTNTGSTTVNISNPNVTTGTGVPGFIVSPGSSTCISASTLAAGDSCTIAGSYTPTSIGISALTATLTVDVNSMASVATSPVTVNASAAPITGTVSGLSNQIEFNTPVSVVFTFTNNSNATVPVSLPNVMPSFGTFTPATSSNNPLCSSTSIQASGLTAGQSCDIAGSYIANDGVGPLTLAATLKYYDNSSSTIAVAPIAGNTEVVPSTAAGVVGATITPLPQYTGASINNNPPKLVWFSFINNTSQSVTANNINLSNPSNGTFTAYSNFPNSCNVSQSLQQGELCNVAGVYTPNPNAQGSDGIQATLNTSNGNPTASTTTTLTTTIVPNVTAAVNTALPQYIVNSSNGTVIFTFINTGNGPITVSSTPTITTTSGTVSATSTTTNNQLCSALPTLQVGQMCDVAESLTAPTNITNNTPVTVNATLNYTVGTSPQTVTISNQTLFISANPEISTTVLQGPPANSVQDVPYIVSFQFLNNTSSQQTGNISFTATNATFTQTSTTCDTSSPTSTNFTISANDNCTVTGSFTPSSSASPGSSASVIATPALSSSTNAVVVPATITATVVPSTVGRKITVINDCPFTVRPAFGGGGFNSTPGPNQSGAVNAGMVACTGNTLYKAATSAGQPSQCFFANPTPVSAPNTSDQYELNPGQSEDFYLPTYNNIYTNVPVYKNGQPGNSNYIREVWSGTIGARTLCTGSGSSLSCATATCQTDSNGTCLSGNGLTPPLTQVEFTLAPDAVDNYDIETINGFNVPVQIKANNAQTDACVSPGSPIPTQGYGACSWNDMYSNLQALSSGSGSLQLPGTLTPADFTLVVQDSSASPQFQGYAIQNNNLVSTSGDFAGYITGDQVCGTAAYASSTPYSDFNCPTNANLFECAGSNTVSCYDSTATSDCCGCGNWQSSSNCIDVNGTPYCVSVPGGTCTSTNPNWESNVLSTLWWIKQACPNLYTYPYDDVTADFVCPNNNNTSDFTITFCPGGATGAPFGSPAQSFN